WFRRAGNGGRNDRAFGQQEQLLGKLRGVIETRLGGLRGQQIQVSLFVMLDDLGHGVCAGAFRGRVDIGAAREFRSAQPCVHQIEIGQNLVYGRQVEGEYVVTKYILPTSIP